ncbi:ABC transporter permease [Ornithinibacillus halotolerans]|uniref:ABC transporter permease protein YtlD n=1 Tax=Ornithinibacillus halotolerans TaxID=1274357 RepID=A0A916W895_9BACI|nr:ABC transporter permease [Ornithinibacillus halotolerans]GGA76399.1 putative ABC transporter permease protein YtlD [Ornithinibacillus halotolerans]
MTNKGDEKLFEQYQQGLRREKRIVFTWQAFILIGFFMMWEVASRLNWIDPLLFSSPAKVIELIIRKFSDGSMISHTYVTLFETLLGFVIGTILGIILASLLWSSTRFSKISDPYLVILNAMPKVALGPIIIVALGPGYVAIIAMGAIISVIITTIVVYTGFREVDPNYEKVLKSFGATRWQCFKSAVFPANLPVMISTLKVNVGLSWVGVIVGEFLVSKEGLGYLIVYGFQVFDFTLVMSALILIAIFAAIMYKVVERIEGWLIKHTT